MMYQSFCQIESIGVDTKLRLCIKDFHYLFVFCVLLHGGRNDWRFLKPVSLKCKNAQFMHRFAS